MKDKEIRQKQQQEVKWEERVNQWKKEHFFMTRKRMKEKLKKVGCSEFHYVSGLQKDPHKLVNLWIG